MSFFPVNKLLDHAWMCTLINNEASVFNQIVFISFGGEPFIWGQNSNKKLFLSDTVKVMTSFGKENVLGNDNGYLPSPLGLVWIMFFSAEIG